MKKEEEKVPELRHGQQRMDIEIDLCGFSHRSKSEMKMRLGTLCKFYNKTCLVRNRFICELLLINV